MSARDNVLKTAETRRGMPYRLDPPPDGVATIDCSLYVVLTFRDAGLPFAAGVRTAEQIRQACVPIAWADVKPGDLLFFEGTYDASEAPGPDGNLATHIGISLGLGTHRMWDANEVKGVGVTDIGSLYWQDHLFEARRPPQLAEDAAVSVPFEYTGLLGIDVSSHQGAIDWRMVAATGIRYGFTKATGGAWYTNPTLAANWRGMKQAGVARGAYHYAFESSGQPFPGPGPEAEAQFFLSRVLPLGLEPGDMLVLDIEEGPGPLGEWALAFCQAIQRQVGFKPLIYTGTWFSDPHGFPSVPALADYPLWIAAYQDQPPATPRPWGKTTLWQYTNKGAVPGVASLVDMNKLLVPASALASLGKPGAVPPPGEWALTNPDVGSGLLEMMVADGTAPASHSTFLPLGRSPALIEEAYGLNGTRYAWHIPTGKHWRYPTA